MGQPGLCRRLANVRGVRTLGSAASLDAAVCEEMGVSARERGKERVPLLARADVYAQEGFQERSASNVS